MAPPGPRGAVIRLTMSSPGNPALRLDEIFVSPPAAEPPPIRRALFIFLLTLAALLHVATAGWGVLYNETDGQYAGGAREMLEAHSWLFPTNDGIPRLQKPPLPFWTIMISLKALGLTTAAARLPTALATCAAVALTFLIGERLGGPWRGFLAGLIHLCACGTFLLGRIIMPEPLLSVFIAAALYCAIRGYERRAGRRGWFVGFWICAALACMTKGFHGLLYPAAVLLLLSCFYREAAYPFRSASSVGRNRRFPAPRLALASLDGMAAPGFPAKLHRLRLVYPSRRRDRSRAHL